MVWKKGESGNPTGKKPGSGKVSRMRKELAQHIPGIIENLLRAAQSGDIAASKILLDRVFPVARAADLAVELDVNPNATLSEQARQVLGSAAAGELPVASAATLITALSTTAKIDESTEILARLDALERRISGG